MPMTNKVLEFMVKNESVAVIILDNNHRLMLDYPDNGLKSADLRFETIEGIDFLVVPRQVTQNGETARWKTYYLTENIQLVVLMEKGSEHFRIDPIITT